MFGDKTYICIQVHSRYIEDAGPYPSGLADTDVRGQVTKHWTV